MTPEQSAWFAETFDTLVSNVGQALLGKDRTLRGQIEAQICKDHYSADYAVSTVLRRYEKRFREMKDAIFVERARDVQDVRRRLLHNLQEGTTQEERAQELAAAQASDEG